MIIKIKKTISISIIYACGFAIIETSLRQYIHYYFKKHSTHLYTTPHQFILTMIWTPMLLLHKNIKYPIIKCLLFPINIYLCEIIGGNIMFYFFNYRAWYYYDRYAFFNGTITLSFYPLWIILFFIENYGYKKISKFIDKYL
jgi:hypothetical protein